VDERHHKGQGEEHAAVDQVGGLDRVERHGAVFGKHLVEQQPTGDRGDGRAQRVEPLGQIEP
jgi:hypothetical protein